MRRAHLLAAVALAACAVAFAPRTAPPAGALAASQVVGAYKLKMKGDGWLRGAQTPYRAERVSGKALMVLSRTSPDSSDGRLRVEIILDPALKDGLLDLATPEPAFVGEGYVVGDSLAVIDTGGPTYVNALTVHFREGGRVTGHWLAAFPASDVDAGAASAAAVTLGGRRIVPKNPRPIGAASR